MKVIDVETWSRKAIYKHFTQLEDPYFGIVIPFDVTKAYKYAKDKNISFFVKYLHDCMRAINEVDNFRYRLVDNKVIDYTTIHASATIMRENKTFGFSFIDYNENLEVFIDNFEKEKARVQNSDDLYPPINGQDCIHCSVLPWFQFTGHKEPSSGDLESVPQIAFSKAYEEQGKMLMNVSVHANHALIDGYHVGLFVEKFQFYLNT